MVAKLGVLMSKFEQELGLLSPLVKPVHPNAGPEIYLLKQCVSRPELTSVRELVTSLFFFTLGPLHNIWTASKGSPSMTMTPWNKKSVDTDSYRPI